MLNSIINVDLHIHSSASGYKEQRGIVADCDAKHCDVLLDKLSDPRHNVRLFSITDHNRFSSELYDAFYSSIEKRHLDISLIPGVEFDVLFDENKPDVHVITIFDARSENDRLKIERAINNDKLADKDDSYDLARYGKLLCEINLPTILIAHQHNGIGANNHRPRSMTAGTDNALNFYKFGYIDALEFSTPKVEAILRSELHDLQLPSSMLTGSDCHDWSVYPKQNPKSSDPSAYSMRLRALPTFKGLLLALTSPNTRIGTQQYEMRANYLSSIEICGKKISLSPGLNAIIGENGVGKSSLLELIREHKGNRKQYVKNVQKTFGVKVEHPLHENDCIHVEQGRLQDNYREGKVFDKSLYPIVDNTVFDDAVRQYSKKLKERVRANIKLNKRIERNSQASFAISPDKEEGQTYYVRVKVDDSFAEVPNPYMEPFNNLQTISRKLSNESAKKNIYDQNEINKIKLAEALIKEVKEAVKIRSQSKRAEASAKSYIQQEFEDYESEIREKSSTQDNDLAVYRSERSVFISAVTELAQTSIEDTPDSVERIKSTPGWGVASNISGGFNFVMAADYASSTDVTADLLQSMFNSEYQTQEAIEAISEEAVAIEALKGATSGDWQVIWDTNLNKFLAKAKQCKPSILDLSENKIGDTLGEEALTFYKYKTSSITRNGEHKVFLVDQPEDNISNARIASDLTKYINRLRNNAQVIMVTHNPLLVVNQDVDNIIVLSNENGEPSVVAGCLESEAKSGETVLDLIADIMDGGRDAIQRRLKAYGQENPGGRRF